MRAARALPARCPRPPALTAPARSCEAAEDEAYQATEAAVMCLPDWTPFFNIVCTMSLALGDLVDNWLNMVLIVVERSVSGAASAGCTPATSIGSVWTDVSDVFASRESLRVVGLTPTMYAVTDGRSAAYYSLVAGSQLRFALENWPFAVDTKLGVAAIQYTDAQDVDSAGEPTTGMFGCACTDGALADGTPALRLSCASVPYQEHTGDAASTTVHPMVWDRRDAMLGLMCKEVTVHVVSLRFSRRRYSQTLGGMDVPQGDPYGTAQGPRTYLSNTADAAVYVSPRCDVVAGGRTDAKCMPRHLQNCFPWCMGLHIAGRKNQQIVLYAQDTWEHNVNVAGLDCAIGADETECLGPADEQDEADVSALARFTETLGAAFLARHGARPTSTSVAFNQTVTAQCDFAWRNCRQADDIDTWVPSNPLNRTDTYESLLPTVRLESQPFVVAGDTFLYAQNGNITVARLRTAGSSEYLVRLVHAPRMRAPTPFWFYGIVHPSLLTRMCVSNFR